MSASIPVKDSFADPFEAETFVDDDNIYLKICTAYRPAK